MADATTRVSTTNEGGPEVMIEIVMKAAKKFMADKGDPTEMEGALMTVQKIIRDGDEALVAVKELCMVREEAVEAREKSIEAKKRVIKAMKKVLRDKKKAIEEKDEASDAKEHATAVREKAIEAREKAVEAKEKAVEAKEKNLGIMAPTAAIGKKRDFMTYGDASEAAGRKKARVGMSNEEIQAKGVPATREPNMPPAVLRLGVINKFATFWRNEADKLQKGLDAAENPEVGIIARAKELILEQYIILQRNGSPKQEAHSVIVQGVQGVRAYHGYSKSSPTIITELLGYLEDVEDGKLGLVRGV